MKADPSVVLELTITPVEGIDMDVLKEMLLSTYTNDPGKNIYYNNQLVGDVKMARTHVTRKLT